MIDVTALAESHFRATGLPANLRNAIVAAFEQGYLAHTHNDQPAAPDVLFHLNESECDGPGCEQCATEFALQGGVTQLFTRPGPNR